MKKTAVDPIVVAKGDALLKQWTYPWDASLSFDDKKSGVDIKLGIITYIRLDSTNSGLRIERPDYDKLVISMMCNTGGFAVATYQYFASVLLSDGSVFLQESGEIVITEPRAGKSKPLEEATNQRPWNMPYTNAAGKSDLPGQDDFEKELEASLENDSK